MSDYGEIITLVIFVLIGLLNSFANKKKKAAEKAKQQTSTKQPQVVRKEAQPRPQKEKNFFESFAAKVENQFSEVDEYFKNLEKEINKKEPPKVEAPKKLVREFKAPLPKVEKKPVKKSTYQSKKYCNSSLNILDLKRKLSNPKTIKEFVVMNEILNKPKALQ